MDGGCAWRFFFVAVDSTCFKPCHRATVGEARRWLLRVPLFVRLLSNWLAAVSLSVCPSARLHSHVSQAGPTQGDNRLLLCNDSSEFRPGGMMKSECIISSGWRGNDRTKNSGWKSMGSKRPFQARRPDQKHGRDGKGFLGCLIFSHAKPLLLGLLLAAAAAAAAGRSAWVSAAGAADPCSGCRRS